METVFNEIQHSVKNWWTSLLLGIVYIIVALWLMFSPVSTYVALSIIFSVSMLISGILATQRMLLKKLISWKPIKDLQNGRKVVAKTNKTGIIKETQIKVY